MKCVVCGEEIEGGLNFCTNCGARVAESTPPTNPTSGTTSHTGTGSARSAVAPTPPKPKKKVPLPLVAAIVAVLVGASCMMRMQPARAYEQATEHYKAGQYEAAFDEFTALGDYEDAAEMAEKASLGVYAQDKEATAGKSPAAWQKAAEAYEKLDGRYPKKKAKECRNYSTYYKAKRLMAKGHWASAKKNLKKIDKGFKNVDRLLDKCRAFIAYEKAEALLSEGAYYQAYAAFKKLAGNEYKGMPDLNERAEACVQDFPADGVTYSNPSYPSTAVPLTINNSNSYTYYKIYSGDDLVRSVFISPNNSVTVNLPVGTYRMNEAHGSVWFGENDMFGGEGAYFRCVFGDEETFDLEWNYSYEISTSYGYTHTGTGIENEEIDMDSF